MFKKRREAKQAEIENARQLVLKGFDEKLAEALQTHDPSERLIKLEDHKVAIDAFIDTAQGKSVNTAKGQWLVGYLGGWAGTTLALDAISILTIGVPASALAIIPSIVFGFLTGNKRVTATHERLKKENEPLFDALRQKKAEADAEMDKVMQSDMRDLSESPKFGEALQRVPKLRDKFAEAYKKHVNGDGLSGPKRKPPGLNP